MTYLEGEIDNATVIVGYFIFIFSNTSVIQNISYSYSVMDRTRQKNHQIEDLNITINQLELRDIYITFHPTMVEYTFFSSAPVAFRRTDHELGHKMNLNKFY